MVKILKAKIFELSSLIVAILSLNNISLDLVVKNIAFKSLKLEMGLKQM